jgi:phosphate starvation-inducible PhoH-like protein
MKNGTETVLTFDFEDNRLLPLLFGERDQYLAKIEDTLNIIISARGNHLVVTGDAHQAEVAQAVLKKLYDRLKKGLVVSTADVDAALRLQKGKADTSFDPDLEVVIPARGRVISPRTPGQSRYIQLMQNNDLVFGIGPAGTGKTYLAVATAVASLLSGQVNRIILSRPAVEAGERLGFLPGDLREKVDPYLRPLFDALYDMLPSEQVSKRISSGEIEIAPLAFMRGRTLTRSFIILDEAQNSSIAQMKMFLTRLGNGSKMVVTGDLTQVDLPPGTLSGLPHALNILSLVPDIGFGYFDDQDIVRHALVTRIVQAYDKQQQK